GVGRDRHGETIVPYTFRHTAATLASAAGVRDRLLADALGHTETSTTARYQHLATEHIRASPSNVAAAVMGRIQPPRKCCSCTSRKASPTPSAKTPRWRPVCTSRKS